MDRVVVLSTKRGELVIVVPSTKRSRAEVVYVDKAEVPTARDTAAMTIAERDALSGGLGQRAQLEAAVRRHRTDQPAGALRAE